MHKDKSKMTRGKKAARTREIFGSKEAANKAMNETLKARANKNSEIMSKMNLRLIDKNIDQNIIHSWINGGGN